MDKIRGGHQLPEFPSQEEVGIEGSNGHHVIMGHLWL